MTFSLNNYLSRLFVEPVRVCIFLCIIGLGWIIYTVIELSRLKKNDIFKLKLIAKVFFAIFVCGFVIYTDTLPKLLNGVLYFIESVDGFEVGDEVEIKYLPKSRCVLEIRKVE